MSKSIVALLALTAVASAASAGTLASSSFDTSTDGWGTINGAKNFTQVATGGDPGGYVRASDEGGASAPNTAVWLFSASSDYLGNQLAALGGTFSYDLKVSTTANPYTTPLPDVKIIGANGESLVISSGVAPTTDWSSYSFTLTPGAWTVGTPQGPAATEADFIAVLSDVTAWRIRGEYSSSLDTGSLDSVVLTSAVPEPSTYALLLAGLGAVGFIKRRRGI